MLELSVASLADTHAVAAAVASVARVGDLIVLSGEMGAGKTAFAQGFGQALGITEPITSPTFTLVHSYDIEAPNHAGRARTLHHADLYRLDRTAEIADLALDELAEYHGIVLVEWGDVVASMFSDHLVVHLAPDLDTETADESGADTTIEFQADTARLIEISASGPSWERRWGTIVAACEEFQC